MDENLIHFILSSKAGIFIPAPVTNENNDFFLILNESNDKAKEFRNEFSNSLNISIFPLKKEEKEITIALFSFMVNEKYFYTCPFILNNKQDLLFFTNFLNAKNFLIILADKYEIGVIGPFPKEVSEENFEYLQLLPSIENDTEILKEFLEKYNEKELLSIVLSLMNKELKEVIL